MNYLNGIFLYNFIHEEKVLCIFLSSEQGYSLLSNLPVILKEYSRYISCLCLKDADNNQFEIAKAFNLAHKAGLKTCLCTKLKDVSKLNANLQKELDYIKLDSLQNVLKKDYSPFGDIEDWIEII